MFYPIEFPKAFMFPVFGCSVSHRNLHEGFQKCAVLARGIDIHKLRTHELRNNCIQYGCEINKMCPGKYTVQYDGAQPDAGGTVIESHQCICSLSWFCNANLSWKTLMVMSFETEILAITAVYWYFVTKGLEPPQFPQICWNINELYGCLFFSRTSNEKKGETPTLKIQIRKYSDGTFFIEDPGLVGERLLRRDCVFCYKYAGEEGYAMFSMECRRRHAVCELCISTVFSKRRDSVSLRDGMVPVIKESHNELLHCPKCEEEHSGIVKSPFPGVPHLKIMKPLFWFGEYPIFSKAFKDCMWAFLVENILWFPEALMECRSQQSKFKKQVQLYKDRIHNCLTVPDCIRQDLAYCVKKHRKSMFISNFLYSKKKFVPFLFDSEAIPSAEILNHDKEFFDLNLGKRKYAWEKAKFGLYRTLPIEMDLDWLSNY